jgi:hypothetical protein
LETKFGKQSSVRKSRELAEQGARVQLVLPMIEVMQLVQDGCGQLLREAGLVVRELLEDVQERGVDSLVRDSSARWREGVEN